MLCLPGILQRKCTRFFTSHPASQELVCTTLHDTSLKGAVNLAMFSLHLSGASSRKLPKNASKAMHPDENVKALIPDMQSSDRHDLLVAQDGCCQEHQSDDLWLCSHAQQDASPMLRQSVLNNRIFGNCPGADQSTVTSKQHADSSMKTGCHPWR